MARYRSARRDLVWGGLALAFLGLVVAAYSVTGDRIYDIAWAPVFLVAALAALAGGAVAAYGRAGPRTRAEPLLPLRDEAAHARDGAEAVASTEPGAGGGSGDGTGAGAAGGPAAAANPGHDGGGEGQREVVVIDCPDCGHRFREEGVRPFQARCPDCGLPGRIPAEPPGARRR